MKQAGFETFEHMADIGVRGFGPSLEAAFVQGARAVFELMYGDLAAIAPQRELTVAVDGYDLESLFVAWLNALLTQADIHGLALSSFEAGIDGLSLTGRAWGSPRQVDPDSVGVEVKGATYSQVAVVEDEGGWVAQCVVDV
jgi:SHS2 domain-containing protein